MTSTQYIGMDVHQESISIAVRNAAGKLVMECVIETNRLRCEEAMKTASREKPNRWANLSSNRAESAVGQNRPCSIQWAAKQEKFRPMQRCFFLTSTFIEQTGPLKANHST